MIPETIFAGIILFYIDISVIDVIIEKVSKTL